MNLASIPTEVQDQNLTARLGQQLRRARKQQKVSAVAAAQAAGMSRVTLHRIERGQASVAMSAWVALADSLGLDLALVDRNAATAALELPERIRLQDYPQLKALAWQLNLSELSPRQALQLYERNWRHLDASVLSVAERELIERLAGAFGGGRLLV
jgi:transcriptional regulator with XRE-family HTH domain